MTIKNELNICFSIAISMLLAGCLAGMPTQPTEQVSLERVQLGDDNLTCSEIAAQVSVLDQIIQDAQVEFANHTTMYAPTAAGTQVASSVLAQTAPMIPIVGPYASLASQYYEQYKAYDTANDQQRGYKAQTRKSYLASLYKQKHCSSQAVPAALTRDVQMHLNKLGYTCGIADGLAGPKTYAAIRKYQFERGLAADGMVTEDLLNYLRVETY